jgi:hypothetical protein
VTAVGLEPTANQLKVDCSTTELRGHALADEYCLLYTQTPSAQHQYNMACQDLIWAFSSPCIWYLIGDRNNSKMGLFVNV